MLINLNFYSQIIISGNDAQSFLQGLITNDINKTNDAPIYAAMLNPQGRFLFDFFILKQQDSYLLITNDKTSDNLIKKLTIYKLRSDVKITKNPDPYYIYADFENQHHNNITFKDPRSKNMGQIILSTAQLQSTNDQTFYHFKRIQNQIPMAHLDLIYDKSLILNYNFDNLNAISYQKGCYVGQEVTARMHHKEERANKKRLFKISVENITQIPNNTQIIIDQQKIGEITSSIFYQNKLHLLILAKEANQEKLNKINGHLLTNCANSS